MAESKGDGVRRSDDASRAKLAWLVGSDMELERKTARGLAIPYTVFYIFSVCRLPSVLRLTCDPFAHLHTSRTTSENFPCQQISSC